MKEKAIGALEKLACIDRFIAGIGKLGAMRAANDDFERLSGRFAHKSGRFAHKSGRFVQKAVLPVRIVPEWDAVPLTNTAQRDESRPRRSCCNRGEERKKRGQKPGSRKYFKRGECKANFGVWKHVPEGTPRCRLCFAVVGKCFHGAGGSQ